MSTNQMREAITKVYSGQKWKRKVANMDDCQVIAVYHRFLREGKLDDGSDTHRRSPKREPCRSEKYSNKKKGGPEQAPSFNACTGEQLSMFD